MLSSQLWIARGGPGARVAVGLGVAVAVLAFAVVSAAPGTVEAGQTIGRWGGPIDPEALQILKGMTDYLGSQQSFSMHTENTYEDVLETGQKIQFHYASSVVIQRPDKLRAELSDGQANQLYVYDGELLTIHEGGSNLFATATVPDNLDDFLFFARDELDLVPPTGDMVFSNAFELLTASVTSGFVVGTTVIDGVNCYHLAFTTPVVDWQVWIAVGDKPLPYRYVLTTRDDPAQPQFVTAISNWNTQPKIDASTFAFEAPANAIEIDFIGIDAGTSAR